MPPEQGGVCVYLVLSDNYVKYILYLPLSMTNAAVRGDFIC